MLGIEGGLDLGEAEAYFQMSDGFNLFYRSWGAAGEINRVVVGIHGGGDHSGRFKNIGARLAADGNQIYALDLRGFGNSQEVGLPRGDVRDFKRHLHDLDEAVGLVRQKHPGRKVFMLGHSMGGCYSLWCAANHPDSVDGLVLAAPGIVSPGLSARKVSLELFFARLFVPTMMYDQFKSEFSAGRDPEDIRILRQDPLEALKLSIRYISDMKKMIMDRALENASQVQKPTLILQGEADTLALPHGARLLYESLGGKDKAIETFPDAAHWFYDAFSPAMPRAKYEPEKREHLLSIIENWLRAH